MLLLSFLMAASFGLLGFTQRPLAFALIGMVAGLGLGAAALFTNVYILSGGYSDEAQADALATGARMYLFGQVFGALLIAGMLAVDLSFQLMFAIAGILQLAGLLIAWLTTKSLEERLHVTMDHQEATGKEIEQKIRAKIGVKAQLLSPFGRVVIGVFLVYAGWQAINGQYTNYFFGTFGIEPEISAAANATGALLGALSVGFYARWFAKAGGLPQFNFHALMRVIGGIVLIGLALVLTAETTWAILLPMLVYILLMQLRPVQDIAYSALAARTAFGRAAGAQGTVGVALTLAAITGTLGAGWVAEYIGWMWVPVIMVALAGLGLIVGLTGRKMRDQLLATAGIKREAAVAVAATVPGIQLPPKQLMSGES